MKLLVSDYDGTFFNSIDNVKLNIEQIQKFISKGNKFVLSSGRSLVSLKRKVEEFNIPYNYLATCDGMYLFDEKDNMLMSTKMSKKILTKLEGINRLNCYERIDYSYERDYDSKILHDENFASVSIIVKDTISDKLLKEYNKIKEENPNYDYIIYGYETYKYMLIKPKNTNKSTPIKFLERHLDLDRRNIYTVGDGSNDIEMIRDFNGYMIGNNRKLKKVALDNYESLHSLINDINKKRVKKRW